MAQQVEGDTGGVEGGEEKVVQGLMDRFARALTAADGKTIATMWETPAFVLGDEMARVVSSPEEVEKFFSAAKEQYNARGITDTRAEILRLDWLADRIASVEVRWPYLDARGDEVGEESSTYILHRGADGDLKIRVAIMQGEATKH